MTGWFDRRLALLVALIAGSAIPASSGAEPVSGSFATTGTVRLASGITVHYEGHGDQNALVDLVRSGDALIARNDSGRLLRFEAATLEVTREWSGPVAATCLVRGEDGAVLAGFADGRIGRIDPANLAATEIARVSGKVQWVGMIPGVAGGPARSRVVAVVERTKWVKDEEGNRAQVPYSIVEDPALGKTYDPDARNDLPDELRATAFLLDRKHRFWLGADIGEWGGWWAHVDLDTGQVVRAQESRYGIEGFSELHDGQVWAFGGLIHGGLRSGFILRVDAGHAETLYSLDNRPLFAREMRGAGKNAGIKEPGAKGAPRPEPPFPTDRPHWPIKHVFDDPGTGTIVVEAVGGIYRTDARLARWEKVHELKIGDRSGQSNALAAYLSVRSVLPVEEPGKPMGLLFATELHGLIRLADGKQTGTRPLGAGSIERIAASSEGILVFDASDDGEIWRYRDGAWNTVSLEPPGRPQPGAPDARAQSGDTGPHVTCVLIDRDGSILTVDASSAEQKGPRTTTRWRDGKAEVLSREVSTLIPSECFATPDGQFWNAEDRILRRFVDGRWSAVGAATKPRRVHRADLNGYELQLVAVNTDGPSWILHDHRDEYLLRLTHGPAFKDPRLEVIPLTEAGRRLKVLDAIAWNQGELLLATDRGLRTFAIDGGKLSALTLNTGGRVVSRLVRDGRGRLWLGGEGLAVLDADGKTLHPLDELPMLGRSKIAAIAADPAHPDGAIAAIADRGVVFVRLDAR